MKPLLFLCLLVFSFFALQPNTKVSFTKPKSVSAPALESQRLEQLKDKATAAGSFLKQQGFSTQYIFLLDMRLPSGKKRFFIFDRQKNRIVAAGLVAHGSCGTDFLPEPRFSNEPGCGCSAIGKYKIGAVYQGRFGKAFKLHGLDSSNATAFQRAIVLHGYRCVPESESDSPICNSLGCPMVSYTFLAAAARIIEKSEKPILLWMYQ